MHKGKRKRYERTRRASNWGSENDGIAGKQIQAELERNRSGSEESGEDKCRVGRVGGDLDSL